MKNGLTTLTGLAFGGALHVVAFWAAGAGHGTSVPMLVSSAPFGLAGITVAFICTPVLWTGIGLAFDLLSPTHARMVGRVALSVHYVSALGILATHREDLSDAVQRLTTVLWPAFVVWGALYRWIQIKLWRTLSRAP